MRFWSSRRNKVITVFVAVVVLLVATAAVYFLALRKDSKNTEQPKETATKLFNTVNDSHKDTASAVAAGSYEYDQSKSLESMATLSLLVTGKKFDGVKAALDKIPDTADVDTVIQKYKLSMVMFIEQKDQENYTKYRNAYKAVLQKFAPTNAAAAKELKSFDSLYLEEAKYRDIDESKGA